MFHQFEMPLPFWTLGCIYGASSVVFGAFGAHSLKRRIADPARLNNWSTAAQYQVILSYTLHLPFPLYFLYEIHFPCAQQVLTNTLLPIATSLRRPTTHRRRSAAECSRRLVIHSRYDYVQWEYIFTSAWPTTIQVAWAYHTSRRAMLNWRMGCVSFYKEGAF